MPAARGIKQAGRCTPLQSQDRNADDPDYAHAMFQRVSEANEILQDEEKRRRYDQGQKPRDIQADVFREHTSASAPSEVRTCQRPSFSHRTLSSLLRGCPQARRTEEIHVERGGGGGEDPGRPPESPAGSDHESLEGICGFQLRRCIDAPDY